ncbi:MAG: hypothetical protein PHF07_01155 [Candidatus Pacebacteria bacterium]|jgi:hypothetical protein|nr:hypothetical protein [Candidatus Paceibacterota bacterium]
MFELLNAWGRVWYPDAWTDTATAGPAGAVAIIMLFAAGIASALILCSKKSRQIKIFALIVLLWSLPALIAGIAVTIVSALVLLFISVLLFKAGDMVNFMFKETPSVIAEKWRYIRQWK